MKYIRANESGVVGLVVLYIIFTCLHSKSIAIGNSMTIARRTRVLLIISECPLTYFDLLDEADPASAGSYFYNLSFLNSQLYRTALYNVNVRQQVLMLLFFEIALLPKNSIDIGLFLLTRTTNASSW